MYVPVHKVEFQGNSAVVFDATETKEKRFVPYEIKEITFKNGLGFAGVSMFGYVVPLGDLFSVWAAGFALNWIYRSYSYMAFTVRKIELNKDGRSVTMHPRIGSAFTAQIKDVEKQRHEKSLVETFEESYLFPVRVAGKQYYLHGNGQESIKNGEVFRAIINGQAIKL